MKCTKIETTPTDRGNRAWFVSTEPVETPSGVKYVYFYLIHDNDVSDIVVNEVYKQGTPIYTLGDAGIAKGVHVHIEAKSGNTYPGLAENTHEVWHMIGNEQLQTLFFANETDIVNGNIGTGTFEEFTFGAFTPYENGWNYHKSETYYVENMQTVTGWKKVDNCWYFFGESGVMQTSWVWSDAWQGWYYLYTSGAEAGQMAVSTWIDKVYYVGSDEKMYKGGVFTVDGVKYSFDNSGVATRL